VLARKPVPPAELDQLMVRFRGLVIEQPWIKEYRYHPAEREIRLD